MSDLSTLPTTPAAVDGTAPSPSSLTDSLATALRAAPELSQSAGTAVAVAASGGDAVSRSQAVARGGNAAAISDAAKAIAPAAGGHGELAKVFGWIGHTVGTATNDLAQVPGQVANGLATGLQSVGNVLNKPLSVVQHEYRYLHDVEVRHGILPAALEGIGLLAGGAVGFAGGGVSGAILGSEAAAGLESQAFYRDSWDRTADGAKYTDPNTGQAVSIGRDIASVVAGSPKGLLYHTISGVIDGLFDLSADPLAEGGALVGKARSLNGAPGKLGDLFGGLGVRAGDVAAEDVDRAYNQYGSVRRQFAQLAGLDTGEIVARYPAFSPIAERLGNAATPEEVKQVFTDVFRTAELITVDRLPTLSFTRKGLQDLAAAAGNAPEFHPSALNIPGRVLNAALSPAQWSRRFTRLGEVVDPEGIDISSREINPTNDYGANAIYKLIRQGESHDVAANVAQDFLNTQNIGRRMTIYRNGVINMLAAKANIDPEAYGVLADAETRSRFKEAIDSLTRGALPGVSGRYGNAVDGRDLSQVIGYDEDGNMFHHAAAVLPNQTGNLRIPSPREVRNAAKALQGGKDYFGRIDDFAFRHFTQSVFKRMVLLTLSYAEHISLAEIIPNGLRSGFTNLIRSGIEINQGAAARLSDEADAHVGAIRGIAYKLLRMDRGVAASDDSVKLAAEYIDRLGGYLSSSMVEAGHNVSNEVKEVDRTAHLFRGTLMNAPKYLKYAKTFGEYGREDEHYVDGWQKVLHEMSLSKDNEVVRIGAQSYLSAAREGLSADDATNQAVSAVRNYIDDQSPRWRSIYERSTLHSSPDVPEGMSTSEDWARVMMEHLKGATHAPDGSPHIGLLNHIAENEAVPTAELDAIPTAQRPITIKGRDMVPDPSNWMSRLADGGFSKLLNPMVNFLSREPLAFDEFKRQWAMVEPGIASGVFTRDEAFTRAIAKSSVNSIRFVHNLHDRTLWTDAMRNLAPFYFAQEQAYRRMGRLLATNPGAFRRYQMMITALTDYATTQNSSTGGKYAVIPGTGFLTGGVIKGLAALHVPVQSAVPVGMGWNVTSANVIFPLSEGARPGIGPVVAVPLEALADLFPGNGTPGAIVSGVVGPIGSSQPIWQQLIPNAALQRVVDATLAYVSQGTVATSSWNSSVISTMQALDYHGLIPDETAGPIAQQDFINRLQNQASILTVMKAILGFVTPVSPEIQAEDYGFPAELTAEIKKAGSVAAGTQAFLSKHPDATPWTVFRSHSTVGMTPASSQEAENWINDNLGFIKNNAYGAMYFMPQLKDTKYDSTVYNEQIAQNLRVKYGPADYLNQLYVISGNNTYYKSLDTYEQQTAHLSGSALSSAYNNFQNWTAQFSAQHPIWAAAYNSHQSAINRTQAIGQMRNIIGSGQVPKGSESVADGIKVLLAAYDTYVNKVNLGVQDQYTHAENQRIKDNYQNYMTQTATTNPELAGVINSVFLYAPTK